MLRKQAKEDKDTTTSTQDKTDKRAGLRCFPRGSSGITAGARKAAQDAVAEIVGGRHSRKVDADNLVE